MLRRELSENEGRNTRREAACVPCPGCTLREHGPVCGILEGKRHWTMAGGDQDDTHMSRARRECENERWPLSEPLAVLSTTHSL